MPPSDAPTRTPPSGPTALLMAALAATCLLTSTPAHAEWRRTTDIDLNTAYTLEEGALSVGLFAPLVVGVTDDFQASIHPLLLLLGQPSLAFRFRVTPVDDVTVSLNLSGAWSFIERETASGTATPTGDETFGFPGTLQLTETTTLTLGRHALFSFGAGVAADFLGEVPIRGLLEVHLSAHLLPAPRHLIMIQLIGFIPFTEEVDLIRPSAQVVYAWSAGARIHLAFGLGLGEWTWESADGSRTTLNLFPVLDVWFRF